MDIKWIKETYYRTDDKKATLKVPPVVIVDLVDHVEKLQAQLARAVEDWVIGSCFKECKQSDNCRQCRKKYIMEGE